MNENKLKQLISILDTLKDRCNTEEATKHSLVLPFLNILGYDVFNPLEVVPEFTADIGLKKGEKIDYAILKNNQPVILIECKHHTESLKIHQNQLIRYFHTSQAKFGILTNGLIYKFYSDLDDLNKLDETPFLEIDLENIRPDQLNELKKFHKDNFDPENILASASSLKYINKFKALFMEEMLNPSEEFTKYFASKVLENKRITSGIIQDFSIIMKKGISQYTNELINNKLKTALNTETLIQAEETATEEEIKNDIQIVTTEEELEGFHIVKSICREFINVSRLSYKDTLNYFNILVDDKVTKWVVRLALNRKNKFLYLPNQEKIKLDNLDELYNYKSQIIDSLKTYLF